MDPLELELQLPRLNRTKPIEKHVVIGDFDCVKSMWEEGYSVPQIAKAIDRGNKFIINRLSELGIDRQRAKLQYGRATCTQCLATYVKKSMRQQRCEVCIPDKFASNIWGRYHLTRPQFIAMFEAQGGRFKLCFRPLKLMWEGSRQGEAALVDHDHETKRVRGLLCVICNHLLCGIDYGRRNPDWMARVNAHLIAG